jgi:hypothetical protein
MSLSANRLVVAMTKSLAAALLKQLREVNFLLRAQAQEIANLRASTEIQFKRIAQMQAELDVGPAAAARTPPAGEDMAIVDFDLWAKRLVFTIASESTAEALPTKVNNLARFLRTVWNADRVASGIAVLEAELSELLGMTETSPSDHWFRHAPDRKQASTLRVWHRVHADNVTAEVAPVTGQGTWRTGASRIIGQTRDSREGPVFSTLVDAHEAADALAQSSFLHDCDDCCGQWHPSERRRHRVAPRAAAP